MPFGDNDHTEIAELLGSHAKGKDGALELVFLSGCHSADLGRSIHNRGVRFVVCWKTMVHDEAAYLFTRGFFKSRRKVLPAPVSSSMTTRLRLLPAAQQSRRR